MRPSLSISSYSFVAALILASLITYSSNAQEIDFSSYYEYGVTVSELIPAEDLNFGLLIKNEGNKSLALSEAKVITIEGVRYLDVFVDVTADNELLLNGDTNCIGDPTCSIPFTLQAAYANLGSNDISDALIMNVNSNVATARFPILRRGNRPAGPPPTPVFEGFNPADFNEIAYIYIYGSVNVGNVNAGTYTANITISVNYE